VYLVALKPLTLQSMKRIRSRGGWGGEIPRLGAPGVFQ
jgi:hypothetical protein